MTPINKYQDNGNDGKHAWYFLYALIIVLVAVDIVKWDADFAYYYNYHCYVVGFIIWLLYSMRVQTIINLNLFYKYSLIGSVFLLILLVKMLLTTFSFPALIAIAFPIIYLLVLRLFLWYFFPEYPNGGLRPIYVFYTKTGVYWDGKEEGYMPSRNEKRFSIWLDLIMYGLMAIVIWFALF